MMSVTGYYEGQALVFGRGLTEDVALANAKVYRDRLAENMPRLGDPSKWTFKRDTVDRQMFQESGR